MLKPTAATAALLALSLAAPALAATPEECMKAVAQTNDDIAAWPEAANASDGQEEDWMIRMDRASGMGQHGNPDECISIVKGIRGELGLKPLDLPK
ncbi:MAG: hypothetical protein AcusKO_34250 [Acuticoccus sp.]